MYSSFADAILSQNIETVRRWPKSDLHNHGALSGDRIFLRERTGHDIVPLSAPLRSMDEMHAWAGANILPYLTGPTGRMLGYEAAFALALRDGVSRIEIGDDVWQITQHGASANQLLKSLQALHRAIAPAVEWIPLIGLSRHCSIAALERWLAPFLELPAYRAIDLYGDESAEPIASFIPLYRRAQAAGLRLKAHVGEWGTADDVWQAVETLHLHEVQHGIAAAASPRVMRFLADHAIRLNLCPASNILLGRVPDLEHHPIRQLFDAGIPVTINTDDALVFGATVSEQFLALFRAGVFTAPELERIRQYGLTDPQSHLS